MLYVDWLKTGKRNYFRNKVPVAILGLALLGLYELIRVIAGVFR